MEQLENMDSGLQQSDFLQKNVLIGSSLLFLHDGRKGVVRMVDFEKAIQAESENIGTREGVANVARILKVKL